MRKNRTYPVLEDHIMNCEFNIMSLISDVYNLTHSREYLEYNHWFYKKIWINEWKDTIRLISDISRHLKENVSFGEMSENQKNIAVLRNLANAMFEALDEARAYRSSNKVLH